MIRSNTRSTTKSAIAFNSIRKAVSAACFIYSSIFIKVSTGETVHSGWHAKIKGFSSCGANQKIVALTFDDGPSTVDRNTSAVLDILHREGVVATFFVSPFAYGWHSTRQVELLSEMHLAGHSIQSHGYMHSAATELSDDDLMDEIARTDLFLADAGVPPATMFRPPFGKLSHHQAYLISSRRPGTVLAMWNVESRDHDLGQRGIADRVESHFDYMIGYGNSAVVLLHDPIYDPESRELVKIIHYFKGMGYRFVTADECYSSCGNSICAGPGENSAHPDVLLLSTFL
jgi:peptidoglycan/xylan/chitin deacetylase (PgdA/CDA1 family)